MISQRRKESSRPWNLRAFRKTGHVVMETTKFEELSSERCRVTTQMVFQSVADRDGMVQANMEQGTVESYQRLDEWLAGNLI